MAERLRTSRTEAEAVIDRFIGAGETLLTETEIVHDADSYQQWVEDTERWHALGKAGLDSVYADETPGDEFFRAATGSIFRVVDQSDGEELQYRQEATRRGINTLRSLKERLDFAEAPQAEEPPSPARPAGDGVFLVHGRNEAAKQSVARFIERVTQPGVTVLEEQPDQGRTIIEKFEQYAAEAGYAVVLLTGDDEGRQRGTDQELRPRARQNVILELGFFVGVLGRQRVVLLYEDGVELPSDISGVLYLPLDEAGAWKTRLGREMLEAGVRVDAEAVLRA
jgi:predicted nucleotide-binding protein